MNIVNEIREIADEALTEPGEATRSRLWIVAAKVEAILEGDGWVSVERCPPPHEEPKGGREMKREADWATTIIVLSAVGTLCIALLAVL